MRAVRTIVARPRMLSDAWPLYLVFVLFPLWWMLGFVLALWTTTAAAILVGFATHRGLRIPAGFGMWVLFLVWMVVSLSQISDSNRLLAWVYRGGSYACGTMLFLYLYNTRKDRVPTALVVRIMALYWCYVAVGGLIAMVKPTLQFSTPMQHLVPHSVLKDKLLYALVHPQAAQPSRILGFLVGRPQMPFDFTNAWGANYALTFPFLVLSWRFGGSTWKLVTRAIAVLSVFPVVFSLDRGLWLSLGLGLIYAALRMAAAGRAKSLMVFVSAAVFIGLVLVVTPLGALIIDRAHHGHSDAGRTALYTQSVQITAQSPIFGYGAPQPNVVAGPGKPSVGTHGQFWLVLVSQGVPGEVVFLGWYAYMFFTTFRRRDPVGLWCHVTIVIAILQLPFYEQLPAPLSITMVAAGLALRRGRRPLPTPALPERRQIDDRVPVPA